MIGNNDLKLHNLAPLFANKKMMDVVRYYLGGRAIANGYLILHLKGHANTDDYVSGQWHHDRCGRRLKLFIYLHDVEDDSHPTLIAPASQNTLYYGMDLPLLTRFSASYVTSSYKVEKMIGPRGGGFLFDTNAIHRGDMVGRQRARTVVVVEFHLAEKLKILDRCGQEFTNANVSFP